MSLFPNPEHGKHRVPENSLIYLSSIIFLTLTITVITPVVPDIDITTAATSAFIINIPPHCSNPFKDIHKISYLVWARLPPPNH